MNIRKFGQGLTFLLAGVFISTAVSSEPKWSLISQEVFVNSLDTFGNPSTLTVSGDSHWFQQTFEDRDVVELPAQNNKGEPLPDGHYRFELRIFSRDESQSIDQRIIIGSYHIASGNFVSMRKLK